jgi:hypothetical protein
MCNTDKPLSDFGKRGVSNNVQRYNSKCKPCASYFFKKNYGTLRDVPDSDKIVIKDLV